MTAALTILVVVSVVIGFLAVEIFCRLFLYSTEPDKFFHSPTSSNFLFFRDGPTTRRSDSAISRTTLGSTAR
jgi:hypothetical protein